MSSIQIGAVQIVGFNPNGIGADIALSGMTVTLGSPNVTGSNFLPQSVVGLGGFKITFSTGVTYTVATVTSRSALTLTTNYGESSGAITGTLHKLVHLRVYVMTPFTPSGETFVAQSGAPGSAAWFRRYGVSVISDGSQNVAHVPQITLPATTDSSVPTARYFAALYTQGGAFIQAFPGCVDEWQLSSLTTPTSWAQICAFNSPSPPQPPLNPESFYTKQQIDARFPSGLANQLIYFKNTGNVLTPLALSADFSIAGDTLSAVNPLKQIQEEGSNLPIRNFLNFVGSSFTAADDVPNTRTNVTADPDLDALASNVTNGLWARTGAGTGAARTLQQPAAGITITNPAGTAGDPAFALANDLAALEGLSSTGIPQRTAADTWAFAPDVTAIEALAGTGLAVRTAADTWAQRSVAGTTGQVTLTNGDGVAGNPTVSLPNTVFLGTAGGSPAAGALTGPDASGTNIAGANLEVSGGKGTGNAVPGAAIVRYPLVTASGAALQSLGANVHPVSVNAFSGDGGTLSNTVVETSLFTVLTVSRGSRQIEGGSARSGTAYRLTVFGSINSTGTPTLRIRSKFGATTIGDTTAAALANNTAGLFRLIVEFHFATVGAAGSVSSFIFFDYAAAASGAVTPLRIAGGSGVGSLDTTVNANFDLTFEFGTASASNNLTINGAHLDRIR